LPLRDPVDGLRDICDAIDMIDRFTEGMDFEASAKIPKPWPPSSESCL
jgi:uncharacterized protein with HEPN domain